MAIEIDFYLREGQNSPLNSIQIDTNFKRIKAAFSQAITLAGTVSSVDVNIFSGLSAIVNNPTTDAEIVITTALNGFVKGNGTGFIDQSKIHLTSDVDQVLPIANGGANNSSYTSNRALVYDGSKFATTTTTTTQLNYLNNVSSDIQVQLNAKQAAFSVLPYGMGGTAYQASSRQDLINNLTASAGATTNYVLTRDSGGNAIWQANTASGVTSVNSQTGAVVLTVSNTVNPFAWSGANLNIPTATSLVTGLLSSANWTTFNTVTSKLSNTGGTISGPILYSGYPTSGSELVNLDYIQSVLNGLKYVTSATAATTTNVNIASAPSTVDGVTLALNDRVLIWQQSDPTQNGVYVFNGAASAFTRSTDADTSAELNALTIFIQSGTTNGNHTYTQTTANPVIGTDPIVFVLSSTSGTYTQGTGITISANIVSLDTAYTDTLYVSKTLTAAYIYVGNASNVATAVPMTGEASIDNSGLVTLSNSAVIAKVLTGFTSGAGVVTASDSILSAFQKINGNVSAITSSQWTTLGSDIYYNSGFVGVGTALPLSSFHNGGSLSLSNIVSAGTGNYTVLSTDYIIDCSTANILNTAVYTVPLSTVVGLGKIYVFRHPYPTTINGGTGGGYATIQLSGSDKFNDAGGLLTSIVIKYGQDITLYSNGNGTWSYSVSFSVINFTTGNYFAGILPYNYGGTGLSSLGSESQLLRVNAGATALEYFTLALSNGNGTTASGLAVNLGGNLTGNTTLTNNGFSLTFAHSSSRTSVVTSAGAWQYFNGGANPTYQYDPTGYGSLPGIKFTPAGTSFTAAASVHYRAGANNTNYLFRLDDFFGGEIFSVRNDSIIRTVGLTSINNSMVISGYSIFNFTNSGSLPVTSTYNFSTFNANPTSGNYRYITVTGGDTSITGTSGNITALQFDITFGQTGTPSGIGRGIYYNASGTYTSTSPLRAWENTIGNVIVGSTSGSLGVNVTAPTAKVHIGAPSSTAASTAPLKLTNSGTNILATPEVGAFEFGTAGGNNVLFFTRSGTTRSAVLTGTVDSTVTVTGVEAGKVIMVRGEDGVQYPIAIATI